MQPDITTALPEAALLEQIALQTGYGFAFQRKELFIQHRQLKIMPRVTSSVSSRASFADMGVSPCL